MVEQLDSFQPLLQLRVEPQPTRHGILCLAWKYTYVNVPLGHTGVLIERYGGKEQVDERSILEPGEYGIGLNERIVMIDTGRKLFNEKYCPETIEGIPTTVGVSMYYNLRPEYAPVFYELYNSVDFEHVLLRPCLETCIDRFIGGMNITNFVTREQALNSAGQPLQQLITQVADGIGMQFTNLHTNFSLPRWQRELAEISASQQLNAAMADIQRTTLLLDGINEARVIRKKHEANQPTETELELARIQSGTVELREQLNLIQQLLVSFLSRQSNP